jgi:glycosyltransferase involved in cell wall biosynthesis
MLAIVIPFYNTVFFEETLQSLANQTNKRFKVYIGNDASPSNPEVLLNKYLIKFDFVYHRFENNLGSTSLTQQWKRCIDLTNNEQWLMILGDDDVLEKNVVEEFYKNVNEIENESIAVVRFATVKIDKTSKTITDVYEHPKIEKTVDFLFRKTRSSLSEYVFLKSKVIDIGFKDFSLAWFSDVLAILEFSDFTKIFTINSAVVKIRISNFSISGKQDNLKLKSKAQFNYYHYLITDKSRYFTYEQRNVLLFKLGKCYLNNKKNVGYFFKISKIYLMNFLIKEYFKFIKSIFYNYFKK